jgi:hypothetical protein
LLTVAVTVTVFGLLTPRVEATPAPIRVGTPQERLANDLRLGSQILDWRLQHKLRISEAAYQQLTAPAGLETIPVRPASTQGYAGCGPYQIWKRAASGDVYGQVCAVHSTVSNGWAVWASVDCFYYGSARLQTCNWAVKWPAMRAVGFGDLVLYHEQNKTGAAQWTFTTEYRCTPFVASGHNLQVYATSDPGATGYDWAVRFQNGKSTNGWWINGDIFTMGSSCYDPGV